MPDDVRDKIPRWLQLCIQLLILYSIVTVALETMPELAEYNRFFYVSEVIVVSLFTIEYGVLWVLSKNRLVYPLRPMAIIDLLAILPFYLNFGVDLRTLRALRMLRIFRVFKLARYSQAMNTLGEAFKRSGPELVMVGFIGLIVIMVSAMGLYYAERDAQPEIFSSIPAATWWAIVTLTTVGYGDVYPVTVIGKAIASIVMLTSIGLLAVPTGVLASTLTAIITERRGTDQ